MSLSEKSENSLKRHKPAKPKRPLPLKKECRTNSVWRTHGAFALMRGYYSNGLSRRTREGRTAQYLESKFAAHCGYDSLDTCPITIQLKVKLAVGNMLFLATYEVDPNFKIGGRDLMTAQNTLNRILTELGLTPAQRPEIKLEDYIQSKAEERKEL